MSRLFGRCALLAAALLALISPARAQDYPSRTITLVVPLAAGTGMDIIARLYGEQLSQRLGKPVIIENKPGAGFLVATQSLLAAPADGHTLLVGAPSNLAYNQVLYKQLPYDPEKDLVPISHYLISPFILVVNPSLPVQSVTELIAYAKANAGKLSFASVGPGVPHHLYMELFKSMTGIQATHVPYRGSLPALNDVIAGHVPMMFVDIGPATGALQAGTVRPLGISSKVRVAGFTDIPPLAEVGLPDFDAVGWQMFVAPAKTPRPIVDRLNRELTDILAQADTKEQVLKYGFLPVANRSVAALQEFVKSETARWGKVVTEAGIAGSQ